MTRKTHSLRHAGTAIAAVLAIASTQGLAQAPAEPVIVVPDIPAAAAPEPATVQPIPQPEPAPPPEAAVEAPEPAPAAVAPRTRAVAPTVRAPQPEPRVEAAEPAAVEETLPPVIAAEPVVEAEAPAAEMPATNDDSGLLALALGGLAILALAIWGFVAIGRRKPVRRYVAETTSPEPVAPAPVALREPVVAERPVLVESRAAHPGALPHTGAAVALPRTLPESFEEREALFNRMVDARPDRANPFTDRRMRMKRARLIMQSIGRDFGQTEPWIDLSQYPNNWPELARKRSAAA